MLLNTAQIVQLKYTSVWHFLWPTDNIILIKSFESMLTKYWDTVF